MASHITNEKQSLDLIRIFSFTSQDIAGPHFSKLLIDSIEHNYFNVFEQLFNHPWDDVTNYNHALRLACAKGRIGMIKHFLANPLIDTKKAIVSAAVNYQCKLVNLLLEQYRPSKLGHSLISISVIR